MLPSLQSPGGQLCSDQRRWSSFLWNIARRSEGTRRCSTSRHSLSHQPAFQRKGKVSAVAGSDISSQQQAADQISNASHADTRLPPWSFHFQHNERYLEWSDSAQEQLLKLHVAEKLGLNQQEVSQRLQHLDLLLPDLVQRLPRLKADLLLKLLNDIETLGSKLLALKTALPNVDIRRLAARFPLLLTDYKAEQLVQRVDDLRSSLAGVDIDNLVEREPTVFNADVPKVLADIRRLLGRSVDPVKYFGDNPRQVMDMQQGGMFSSAETGSDHGT